MNKPYPPGHPLAVHPGLPPHPLDGVPGAFKHTEHHAPRMLPRKMRAPIDPRLIPLVSSQGHDLPQSPVDQIAPIALEGHSELPLQQPGAGADDGAEGRDIHLVSPVTIMTPYASRASSGLLDASNVSVLTGGSGIFPIPLYSQQPGKKVQIAQLDLAGGDSSAFSVVFQVAKAPFHTLTGAKEPNVQVAWEVSYGYGGVNFIRNLTQQQGRIIVVGNFVRISAYLATGANSVAFADISALASAMILPVIDGELRSTTAWGTHHTTTGQDLIIATPATMWRIGGEVSATTGGTPVFLIIFDRTATPVTPGTTVDFGDLVLGEVPQGATFSADVATSGFDFAHGMVLAASTTPDTLTVDAGAHITYSVELLVN